MFGGKNQESRIIEKVTDPNTGEIINRASVAPDLIESIKKEIQVHSGTMNEFVMNSQNYFSISKRQHELLDKIKSADNSVKAKMNDVMKKSKLDPKLPWAFNMVLGCFEYRQPPIVPGMSEAEIRSSQMPMTPPTIVKKEGVVA